MSSETETETEAVQPFEPLMTERLIIRMPVRDDFEAIVARRNDPDVARYQDWELPHPPERTSKRLDGAIEQGGLADGEWWMATVTLRDGTVIGDLAINISWGWRASEVGYSFNPAFWGKGYAAEALDALLNHLFNDRGIQRVSASLHPDNHASAMLLERVGFIFEGRTKLSFWLGDGPDAENSDDGLYGLTKADREAWLARPTGPPDEVKLIDINNGNQVEVSKLATHKSQERLVATVLESFADALFADRETGRAPRMWAIEADGEFSGFVMIAEDRQDNQQTEYQEQTEHQEQTEPYLWRMLIDRRFQRRGIGSRAVELVEEYCRSKGATSITVSWEEGKGSPEPFYLSLGYVPTGSRQDNEVEARKQL